MSSIKFPPSRLSKAARTIVCSAFVAAACPVTAVGETAVTETRARWPDDFQSRLMAWALIETLNADLLASHSATLTLGEWCAHHHLADPPKIVAHLQTGATKPISPEQRRDLNISANEPVVYRRVDLVCGTHVLSQADNWYVPSRLTAAMNVALTSSDTPFGLVIRPLHPQRRTLDVTIFWRPLAPDWDMHPPSATTATAGKLEMPPLLFQHRAVVSDSAGQPISEVVETYTRENFDFLHGK